jgi:HTH-type transcriptional regulator / antitoxin HigA
MPVIFSSNGISQSGNGRRGPTKVKATFNPGKYAKLLAEVLPSAVDSDEEAERYLGMVDDLMEKGQDNLSPEEDKLLNLLIVLVQDFEDRHYPMVGAQPVERLKYLMKERNLASKDLLFIFGTASATREILSGERGITRKQAQALADFFSALVFLFL